MRTALLAAGLLFAGTSVASAHIHLLTPKSRTDDAQGNPQKTEHCGTTGWVRGDHLDRVTTFSPGQTITVTWAETINHPGWFRISIQPNGEIFGIPPAGGAAGEFPTVDQTGMTLADGSIVLKDRIADGTLSTDVTLPNMECSNCTLQFIQVMTDKPPYTTDAASDDIYFNCADITLSAGGAPDAGVPDAGTNPGTPDAGGGTTTSGGCSTSGGAGGACGAVLLAFAGLALRRRRR